tara:strand:+ start:301 stop:459 length:159 start_codon:yes stop_codon:yes gene_type:complete
MGKQESLEFILDRMKYLDDEDRYSLMCEWCEMLFDDNEDTLTIPKHFKLKKN